MEKKYHNIQAEIDVSDFIDVFPDDLKEIIKEAERYDLEGREGDYLGYIELIENLSKQYIGTRISEKQWIRLLTRYSIR